MTVRKLWRAAVVAFISGFLANDSTSARDSQIATVLPPFADNRVLAGRVTLVTDKDKVHSMETVGWPEIAARKPMKADAVFWIASMSKPIIGTTVMMLVDEGRIQLDDPVEKYLTEFNGQWLAAETNASQLVLRRPRHPITVSEVLSHTSGLPFKSAMEEPMLDGLVLRDAVNLRQVNL